jgi:shikimate kinase
MVPAAGISIREIFAFIWEQGFWDRERRVVARLLAGRPAAIAAGGGGFLNMDARAAIRSRAVSVWLRAELNVFWDRVRDRPGRPLLKVSGPPATLVDLHRRRAPIYSEADVVVDSRPDFDQWGVA